MTTDAMVFVYRAVDVSKQSEHAHEPEFARVSIVSFFFFVFVPFLGVLRDPVIEEKRLREWYMTTWAFDQFFRVLKGFSVDALVFVDVVPKWEMVEELAIASEGAIDNVSQM